MPVLTFTFILAAALAIQLAEGGPGAFLSTTLIRQAVGGGGGGAGTDAVLAVAAAKDA